MRELVEMAVILVVWVGLLKYVFPRLGIPTCMSGQCGIPDQTRDKHQKKENV